MSALSLELNTVPGEIQLDYPCWQCTGHDIPDCGVCNGTGYQLMPAGRTLLEFMKRHVKATARVEL
jgi:hypothetical protein